MRLTRSWRCHARCDRVQSCAQGSAKAPSARENRLRTRSLTAALAALLGLIGCASSPEPKLQPAPVPARLAAEPNAVLPSSSPSAQPTTNPSEQPAAPGRWSEDRAKQWQQARGWLVGVNYIPSTAVNQLEMWQADTFDPTSINRELGWAESLGFTSLRVFLHDLAWKEDEAGFYERVNQFLGIAQQHHLGVMLVIFDGVWNPLPKPGKQPTPRPHLHNSGWVQSPGAEILGDPSRHDELQPYVKGIVGRFKDDRRIDAWDVFNEPDNGNTDSYAKLEVKDKATLSALLIEKTFRWAREAGASQPLTAAPWLTDFSDVTKLSISDKAMLNGSDVISFHNYAKPKDMRVR
ncbi:MAG: endo-1,4-beta-xylanase, partial [Planctomycetia bacterium]|nr:endo-1,4-beta-xylanase [Planctomycetia bacterium]